MNRLLGDWLSDVVALAGLVASVAGLVLSYLSFRMAGRAKTAAEAAREAAQVAAAESRVAFIRYSLGEVRRLAREVQIHYDHQNWTRAADRLMDLADQIAQLAHAAPEWRTFIGEARTRVVSLRRIATGQRRPPVRGWDLFLQGLLDRIDRAYGPFAGNT